jgi:sterol-4alpha-carboxylate 3-dehydrogenase (decarboxylating)
MADALVLAANSESLKTACLRLPSIYGEGDMRVIPGILGMMRQGKQNMQIGPDRQVFEHVWVGNAVLGLVLCGKALLTSSQYESSVSRDGDVDGRRVESGVAGQAFFITDGQPLSYYTFARKIWYIAGDRTEKQDIRLVSFWLVIGTAWMNEVFYFVFSAGQKRPSVGTYDVKALSRGVSWSIEKARSRLGYVPSGMEDGLRRGVEGAIYDEEMSRLVAADGG